MNCERTEAVKIAKKALYALSKDAVSELERILKSQTAKDALKVQCAQIILDRVIGKPLDEIETEAVEITPSNVLKHMKQQHMAAKE